MQIVTGDLKLLAEAIDQVTADKSASFKVSGKVRYAAAKNYRILSNHVDDFEKARVALILSLSNGKTKIEQGDENYDKFVAEFTAMSKGITEVENILPFKLAELDLDNNPIPTDALALLIEYNLIDES